MRLWHLLAAGAVVGLVVSRASRASAATSAATFLYTPDSVPHNRATVPPASDTRLARLDAQEKSLWAQEQALLDQADKIARGYAPGWQVAVGNLRTKAQQIAQERGKLNYIRSQIQQGRM